MTDAPTPPDAPSAPEPKRRSCLGCAFKGGLGCAAFLVGGLLVLALVGPGLAAGYVARMVREDFARRHAGSLAEFEIEPSWRDVQHVRGLRLLDPDGEPVLSVDVELPGLVDWFEFFDAEREVFSLGRIRCEVSGDLVADETGRTNLQRALEPRERSRRSVTTSEVKLDGRNSEDSVRRLLESLEFVVDVSAPRLTFSDPETRRLGTDVALRDLEAQLRARPEGSWTLTADADVEAEESGRFELSLTAREPDWFDEDWPLGEIVGELDLRSASTRLVDALVGEEGRLVDALGPLVDLELVFDEVTANSGRVELSVVSEKQRLDLTGRFSEGAFRMEGADRLAWSLEPPRALLAARLADVLPPELAAAPLPGGPRWTIEVDELSLPVDQRLLGSDGTLAERLFGALGASRFAADLSLGGWEARRGDGPPLALRGVELHARQTESGPALEARTTLVLPDTATPAELSAELRPRNLWEVLARDAVPAWDAELRFSDLSVRALLAAVRPDALDPTLEPQLEGTWRGEFQAREGVGERARLGGVLTGPDVRVALSDLFVDETHLVRSGDADLLNVTADGTRLEPLLALFLPEGVRVAFPASERRCALVVESASLARPNDADADLVTLVEGLVARLRFDVPGVRAELGPGRVVDLADVAGDVVLPRGEAAHVALRAAFPESPGASLVLDAASLEPWSPLVSGGEPAAARFVLDVTGKRVPSALVDALAEQDGLIVDVLGPELEFACTSPGLGLREGPLEVHMTSALGRFDWKGRLEDGRLISSGEDRLEAHVGLSPLLNERIVGRLVPLLVDATKEPGAEPVLFELSECVLPLAGDLSGLNGKLRLDLGAVQYRVLPQLRELFGSTANLRTSDIAPLDLEIVNGAVRYDDLVFEIADRPYTFSGSIDLTTRGLDLRTEVPLRNLGTRIDAGLQRLVEKGVVSGDVAVPVTLGGTLLRPSVGLQEGFLKDLAKQALPGALEGLLDSGLDRLLRRD